MSFWGLCRKKKKRAFSNWKAGKTMRMEWRRIPYETRRSQADVNTTHRSFFPYLFTELSPDSTIYFWSQRHSVAAKGQNPTWLEISCYAVKVICTQFSDICHWSTPLTWFRHPLAWHNWIKLVQVSSQGPHADDCSWHDFCSTCAWRRSQMLIIF